MDKAYFGEMTLRALTPEYLDWYAKLVEIPIKPESSRIKKDADDHILQDSLLETQVMAPNKIYTFPISKTDPNKNHLYQYAIEHRINPKEFLIITETEKNR
ncbi:19343_t:CDS:2 [Cetraspora pellucida]|uniref:19343_t:CDS:1 n=1 Tax=Cetraspora pellucida TaxID=1433469 RepID=A0A9N8VYL7_9GLOM|nr:19343_t:CDS:2 [Cetraspora pellucida]